MLWYITYRSIQACRHSKKNKAQSFESRHLQEISSIDPDTRIQMKTVSGFILKIIQINFVQIFAAQWDL